jgi:hypothetical protein
MYAQVVARETKHPEQEKFPLRASKSVMDRVRAIAFLDGESVNDTIVNAMQFYWENHPKRTLIELGGPAGLEAVAKKKRRK